MAKHIKQKRNNRKHYSNVYVIFLAIKMTTNYFVPASLLSIVSPNFASELFCNKMKLLKKTSNIRVCIIGMS